MTYYLLHAGQPSAKRLLKRVADIQEYRSAEPIRTDDVVIRWGQNSLPDPLNGTVLNPQSSLLRAKSRTAMASFLRKMGVRVLAVGSNSGNNPNFVRHYRFPIFDLRALACFRSDSGPAWLNERIQRVQDHFREVALDDDKVTTRAMYTAIRALHALGLDHGLVSISMAPKGVLYVVDITPNPLLKGRLLDLYAAAIENHQSQQAKNASGNPFLLGTDVELMLRNQAGKMVLASNYFTRKGKIGCDDRSVQFDGKRLPLLELRPDPNSNPLNIVAQLRELMVQVSETINREQVEWRAGSMPFRPYSIGGHIHFSGVPFSSRFVRVLDNYLGLPLMLVEDQSTAVERRQRYGFYGDVRHKDYGGFEYRTPASFIVSPEVTAAALCLAYVVGMHHRELPIVDLYDRRLQAAFFNGDREVLSPIAEQNLSFVTRLPAYQRYREYIDPLITMIQSRQTWNEKVDIRRAWDIPLKKPKAAVRPQQRRRRAARA